MRPFLAAAVLLAPVLARSQESTLVRMPGASGTRIEARAELPELMQVGALGPSVHRSCLDSEPPEQRAVLRALLDDAVAAAYGASEACQKDLDGLEYLAAGREALRRLVIVCADPATDAHFLESPKAVNYTVYPENFDRHPVIKRLAQKAPEAYFMVTKTSLRRFLEGGTNAAAGGLFHESLHDTKANNRWDHNEIEGVAVDPDQPCARNRLDDRIIMLEALCGFSPGDASSLRSRVRLCGQEMGCQVPFWMVANVPRPSSDASRQERYGEELMRDQDKTRRVCDGARARLGTMARTGRLQDREAVRRVDYAREALGSAFDSETPKPSTPDELQRDRRLKAGTAGLLGELKAFARGDGGDAVALGTAAVSLYQRECPLSGYEFRPPLCERGEAVLISAALDIRSLLSE